MFYEHNGEYFSVMYVSATYSDRFVPRVSEHEGCCDNIPDIKCGITQAYLNIYI